MNAFTQLVIPNSANLDSVRLDYNRCLNRCNTEAKAQGRAARNLRLSQGRVAHHHPGARLALGNPSPNSPLHQITSNVIRSAAQGGRKKRKSRRKRRKTKRKTKKRRRKKKRKTKKRYRNQRGCKR